VTYEQQYDCHRVALQSCSSNAIALRPKPEPHNQGPTCPTRPQQRMSWCDMTAVGGRQPGPSRVSTAGSRRHSCKRDYALAQAKARGHQVTLATVATSAGNRFSQPDSKVNFVRFQAKWARKYPGLVAILKKFSKQR
jgi:hypothetical protein